MKKIIIFFLLLITTSLLYGQRNPREVNRQAAKFQRLLALVDAFYVDEVGVDSLTEDAVVRVLAKLDPHSMYISKEELDEMNEPLEGEFFGIGIQYSIIRDTLMVVEVISEGPSERVGIQAGDRIVKVQDKNIAGINITNNQIRDLLRGPKGSSVNITVMRDGDIIPFRITRGKVPIYSIPAVYMMDDEVGYIKVTRFGATTAKEFEQALRDLKAQGMRSLVLDLQSNGGGYLGAAIDMCDNFLSNDQMIVYTDSRMGGTQKEFATAAGVLEEEPLVILLDRNSASASEVVAGAVQDWDRGVIVGRRSFGKGLVQRQFPLTDGSLVRLTVSHYYTPSGRCIQKPYKKNDYEAEVYGRYESGELLSKDSIQVNDSLMYRTLIKNRKVYGGGGIIPDVFVPIDTTIDYTYLNMLIAKNVLGEFMLDYIDNERTKLEKQYSSFNKFKDKYKVSDELIDQLVKEGEKEGIEVTPEKLEAILPTLKLQIKALVARDLWSSKEMYEIYNTEDPIVQRGYQLLKSGLYQSYIK